VNTGTSPVSLYQAHQKVYPREVDGRFQRLRRIAVFVLLGLFYLLPWIDIGGRQSVLFDLPARRFHVFGLTLWPQDFIFLTWLLVMAGLSLFFFTAVAGRVWCGFACPQTVWTEVFVAIERWIEGDRNRRIKLDRGPWTREKILRKCAKHSAWLLVGLWTGFTFVGFFTPIRTLAAEFATWTPGPWETFWTLFYGFATWGNAGFMREQVCKYMCPYARFQSAMFDRDTLIVAYDTQRGEPRGARPRAADRAALGRGDCVDCKACVQVCPTGIDIREGLQYECISCAACIDACDAVMDRMHYPRGLIRYSSQRALEGSGTRVLRPRTLVYGALLVVLFAGFLAALALRNPLGLDVIRDRNALYRLQADGSVENVYTLRILNKDEVAHSVAVRVDGLDGARIETDRARFDVAPGSLFSTAVRVRVPPGTLHGGRGIAFTIETVDPRGLTARSQSRFIAP
jgi:cytochrome c oxidase accessory protein FixG